jgi:hypothetical protein
MLRSSSVVSLMVPADAWKGRNSGTSHTLLLGASATGPLGLQLGLLHTLASS